MDSTITGTENTIWVRTINHIPDPTRLNPLDPQSRSTDKPREEVGMIKGTLSKVLIIVPYCFLSMIKAKGIAIHIATYVEIRATIKEVKVD
jgi:hypothetical protein